MKRAVRALFVAILILSGGVALAYGSTLEVVFLDVGEGEAIYIKTPDNRSLLVDVANPKEAKGVIEFLRSKGVEELEALFITHPHPDHMGGLFQLLSTIRVKRLYDNGQPIEANPQCDIYRWYKEALRSHPHYRSLKAGRTLKFGPLTIDVLSPSVPLSDEWNENSLVLRLHYRGKAFLLMGDAMEKTEKRLLKESPSLLRADVLKAGHHGSEGTLTEEFLRKVAPSYVVISIDRDNLRGYPSKRVLKRLDEMNLTTLITYRDGSIGFLVDEKGRLRPLY